MRHDAGTATAPPAPPAPPAPDLGSRLQALRARRGLTQRQLAEPEYTAAYVSTLEAGRGRPSETALRYFAEKLGSSYEELATGVPGELRVQLRTACTDVRRLMHTATADEALDRLTPALELAERYAVADLRAELLLARGDCLLRNGESSRARADFELAESLLADEPLHRRASAISGKARAIAQAGELRYACYLIETLIDELHQQGVPDPRVLTFCSSCVITLYLDLGMPERAATAAEAALALAGSVEDPAAVAGLHCTVARTLAAQGRFEAAEEYLVKAQAAFEEAEHRDELALCHWMRGYLHAQHESWREAERELELARRMLVGGGARFYTIQIEVELADVRRRLGHGRDAVELLEGILSRLGPGRGIVHAAAAHRLLGQIAQDDGTDPAAVDPRAAASAVARAETHYRTAIALQEQAGAGGDLAATCVLLGDLLRGQGRAELAAEAYRRGLIPLARPGTTTLGPAAAR